LQPARPGAGAFVDGVVPVAATGDYRKIEIKGADNE
jgi:hypothetical protein